MPFCARLAALSLFGIAFLSGGTLHAEAEEVTATQTIAPRRVQLGLSLNLISYQRAAFDITPINSGQTFDGSLTRTGFGPSGGSVMVEPGIVLGNRWVLGLLLDIGSQQVDLLAEGLHANIQQTLGSFAIGPRALYLFNLDSKWRPYALLAFGYTTTPSRQDTNEIEANVIDITEYQGFAGLGTHWFLDPAFSLDMSVRSAYGIGSGYVNNPPLENANLEGTVFSVMWSLGTSGWLL